MPVPGVKLGLANVVTLFALTRLSARDAFAIVVTRVAISSLLDGQRCLRSFLAVGGLLSLIVMGSCSKPKADSRSLFGVSVGGAAAHNIGQMAAAVTG